MIGAIGMKYELLSIDPNFLSGFTINLIEHVENRELLLVMFPILEPCMKRTTDISRIDILSFCNVLLQVHGNVDKSDERSLVFGFELLRLAHMALTVFMTCESSRASIGTLRMDIKQYCQKLLERWEVFANDKRLIPIIKYVAEFEPSFDVFSAIPMFAITTTAMWR